MLRTLYRKVKCALGLDYNELPTEEVSEAYMYSAPLPTCDISGCIEEMHSTGNIVYNYCKKHLDQHEMGNVMNVCQHPSCVSDIDRWELYCMRHRARLTEHRGK